MAGPQYQAQYHDGQSARQRQIGISIDELATGSVLNLHDEDGRIFERWAFADLRHLRDQGHTGAMVLFDASNDIARLTIQDEGAVKFIRTRAPRLNKKPAMARAMRKALVWAVGAIASVLLIVFVLIPALSNQLAAVVPVESERKMGQAVLKQIRWGLARFGGQGVPVCTNDQGQAALDKMAARMLDGVDTPHPFTISVFDHDMVNAFALPGGQIVLFKGLLDAASSPEEVAGVLAHEAGHVVHRDPLRAALRSSGTAGVLGLVLGDFTGGAFLLIVTEQLISASYSQAAETAADEFAVELLNRSNLPTAPFAEFFLRLKEEHDIDDDEWHSHLAAHPALGQRAENAKAAGTVHGAFERVLSEAEWDALRDICAVHGPLPEPTSDDE